MKNKFIKLERKLQRRKIRFKRLMNSNLRENKKDYLAESFNKMLLNEIFSFRWLWLHIEPNLNLMVKPKYKIGEIILYYQEN